MQGTSLTKRERECKLYDAIDKFTHIKSKFVTDVKLVKDLHTTNFDQLRAYLDKHELHANEVRLLREQVPYSETYLNDMENQDPGLEKDMKKDEEVVVMDDELQGRLNQEEVNVASKEVSAVSAPELFSVAEPIVFDDEDVTMTMAQTLIKLKAEKAKLLDEHIA
uniref:Integrase, catalytic region, zinc finger, CCHC-type, peptidase aspartic, catalytic n=1 Tax=Tanacetum cinerariifolium TaxID=118510 RepID=A0A6L2N6M4_TANCI|nr:hypothetical protein [Tanacetum cinerariifolium]